MGGLRLLLRYFAVARTYLMWGLAGKHSTARARVGVEVVKSLPGPRQPKDATVSLQP